MILTVNPNAAVDHVLFVKSLDERGTIRADQAVDCIGGKGADTALALSRLGAPHRMVSFAAGAYGRILENLYQVNGIEAEQVWVTGETRVVTVIVETDNGCLTQISHPGYSVSRDDCERFLIAVEQAACGASFCVAAGSLPPGAPVEFYRQVSEAVHRAGAQILIDSAREPLLVALSDHPEMIKLNRSEYQTTFHTVSDTLESIAQHARGVIEAYRLRYAVITLSDDGILLVGPNESWHACGPRVAPVNPAGAGDAASAALACRLSLGESVEEAIRWACAAGAAAVQTEITADLRIDTVISLLPRVEIHSVGEGR